MPKIVSCVNLKGGVGKTAIAVNFAAYCAKKGLKTLLVDLDPQTNATFSCIQVDAWEKHAEEHGTVADLLDVRRHASAEGGTRDVKTIIRKKIFGDKKLHLIPSHLDLFTIDLDLASATARERKLKKSLTPVIGDYDVVVCDCPPNLTIPTQNALALSTHYVVPISPDYLSALGVALLLTRVEELTEALEQELEHVGIIISRVGRKALHRAQTVAGLRKQFGDLVFKTEIQERVAVSEAAARNLSVYQHGDSQTAEQFSSVSEELLERLELKP